MERDIFLDTLLAHFTHKQLLNEIVKHLSHAQLLEAHDSIVEDWDVSDPDNYNDSMDGDHHAAAAWRRLKAAEG